MGTITLTRFLKGTPTRFLTILDLTYPRAYFVWVPLHYKWWTSLFLSFIFISFSLLERILQSKKSCGETAVRNRIEKKYFVWENTYENKNNAKNFMKTRKNGRDSIHLHPAFRLLVLTFLFSSSKSFSTSPSVCGYKYSKHWNKECSSKRYSAITPPIKKSSSTSILMQKFPFDNNDRKSPKERMEDGSDIIGTKKNYAFSNQFFHHPFFSSFSNIPFFQKKRKQQVSTAKISITTESESKAILLDEGRMLSTGHTSVKEGTLIKVENERDFKNIETNNDNMNNNQFNQLSIKTSMLDKNLTITHKKSSLISFQTAGNWKVKKRTWSKYRKNTGWKDPYRDGEDSFQNPLWRFFAEIFFNNTPSLLQSKIGSVKEKRMREGMDMSKKEEKGRRESEKIDKVGDDYDNNYDDVNGHGFKHGGNANSTPHQEKEIIMEFNHDDLQIGVIGYIKSETGTFYIRNNDSNIEFETVKSGESEMSPEFLSEMELFKSIRHFAHPSQPKF